MKVLHVLPDTVADPRQRFLGSTKDARGRTEYFRERGLTAVELIVPGREDAALLRSLEAMDLADFQAVFLELPIYPRSQRFLRRRSPHLKLVVRSINAEFPHQLHQAAAGLRHRQWRSAAFHAASALRRLYLDFLCARRADHMLGISDWDTRRYWNILAGRKKTRTLPYFVPRTYLEDRAAPPPKTDSCICLMSTLMNSFLIDAARNFHRALEALGDRAPGWSFSITGADPPAPRRPLPRLVSTGFLDSPFDLLARSRAMALLSDYGFGFKTKILEAILLRCFVLVTPRLHARLPEEVKPFCLPVDLADPDSLPRALERCRQPFPETEVNARLRARAFAVLDEVLGSRTGTGSGSGT